ncbi:hypothetical protein [Dyadobacter chenhuakuii]|uniref:Uncharacterized protein n=1 Tax=Dyadobacter chenhuakuii TaxID=2909339 RepID=A0A9X1U3P0_9BACT|nr:hypothetical protein [Dyadobacter chenhuakuii]MCF2501686.1 hypothetical protein [Dyadobacter chenhuakuii]
MLLKLGRLFALLSILIPYYALVAAMILWLTSSLYGNMADYIAFVIVFLYICLMGYLLIKVSGFITPKLIRFSNTARGSYTLIVIISILYGVVATQVVWETVFPKIVENELLIRVVTILLVDFFFLLSITDTSKYCKKWQIEDPTIRGRFM